MDHRIRKKSHWTKKRKKEIDCDRSWWNLLGLLGYVPHIFFFIIYLEKTQLQKVSSVNFKRLKV